MQIRTRNKAQSDSCDEVSFCICYFLDAINASVFKHFLRPVFSASLMAFMPPIKIPTTWKHQASCQAFKTASLLSSWFGMTLYAAIAPKAAVIAVPTEPIPAAPID